MKRLFIFLLLILMVGFSVNYSQQEQAEGPKVEVKKLTDHIYCLRSIVPVGAQVFEVNMVASVGPDGLLMVDTGFAQTAEKLQVELNKLYPKNPNVIINSHAHADHTGANRLLGKGATIISHVNARKDLTSGFSLLQDYPKSALPGITFKDNMTIHFNGDIIKLLTVANGHTDSDILIYFTKAKVVYTGSTFYEHKFPFINLRGGCTFATHVDNIKKYLNEFPEDIKFVPGHGAICSKKEVSEYLDMLQKTSAVIKDELAKGKSAEQMKKDKVLKDWESWGKFFVSTNFWIDTLVNTQTGNIQPRKRNVIDALHTVIKEGSGKDFVTKYLELQQQHPDEYNFTEGVINAIGYYVKGKNRLQDALEIFKFNVAQYPKAFNTYDSLGEIYLNLDNKKLAKKNYKKSLKLNPDNANAKTALERIKKKK